MAIENAQLNSLIDQFRGEAERLRAAKARINSMVARWYLISGDVPNDATAVTETRPDAANLEPLTGQTVNDFAYALTLVQAVLANIPEATLEQFAVRALEISQ